MSTRRRAQERLLLPTCPSLLTDRTIDGPDQVWAGAIVRLTWRRFRVYLAVVMDIDIRQILGWAFARRSSSELVVGALAMALTESGRKPEVFQSAPRDEYVDASFVSSLESQGIQISRSATKGRAENGIVESSLAQLLWEWGDDEQHASLEAFIGDLTLALRLYNTDRIHRAIRTTPDRFYRARIGASQLVG